MSPGISDGPASPLFVPVPLGATTALDDLASAGLSADATSNLQHAPSGLCVCFGIPFAVDKVAVAVDAPVELRWVGVSAPWLVFMHTTDVGRPPQNEHGFFPSSRGHGLLKEHVGTYTFLYADGTETPVRLYGRHQVGMVRRMWGQNCFEAVAHIKPSPQRLLTEQPRIGAAWGWSQTRVTQPDSPPWVNWLWAWRNPNPEKTIVGLHIDPGERPLILSAITAGQVSEHPLRWESRRKAVLRLPEGAAFDPNLSPNGLSPHLALDLGQVISALPRFGYASWEDGYNNQNPVPVAGEVLVEYAAHREARFHLQDGRSLPVGDLGAAASPIRPVARAERRVTLRVVDETNGKLVPAKLHIHGEAGEYLAPVDRHRIPNRAWYEDWSVDYVSPPAHACSYIPGETVVDLPLGRVYIEVSKGFEIRPIRRAVQVTPDTKEITLKLERVLDWRERGWVTADTHVHFLSPPSAHLEGSGEGVNVVNLLASQWGELMTNVGDFDGRTTYGSKQAGGDGEYLVRVGTENRQHVLGHISLLGYNGRVIAPMTSGGPDESALGDPVDVLLTEWARQCRAQGGIVILPHFPNPRAEHAAAVISGDIEGVEMTAWSNLYGGIDPYSLSDWYRYLNCGHFVAAVGGTDKMCAETAVGAVRTYAKLPKDREFDYEAWKDAVRSGYTFATYGPLMELSVDGHPPGARVKLTASGGTLDVEWSVASVTVPMTRVELIVSGGIRESSAVDAWEDSGAFSVRLDRSGWIALLVRGHYADKPEIITAHSSPVMVEVEGTPFLAAADALTILDQIEGALVYLDTVGTRAETAAYQRMRLVLTSAYRSLHNRLHQAGHFHEHALATDHAEHH